MTPLQIIALEILFFGYIADDVATYLGMRLNPKMWKYEKNSVAKKYLKKYGAVGVFHYNFSNDFLVWNIGLLVAVILLIPYPYSALVYIAIGSFKIGISIWNLAFVATKTPSKHRLKLKIASIYQKGGENEDFS